MASAGILCAVGTYYLTEPVECTLKHEADMLDSTHLGSAQGAREFISGPTKWTMSTNGDWATADAVLAFNQLVAQGSAPGACVPIALTMNLTECGGANHTAQGTAYITSLELGTPVDGKISMAIEWQGSGIVAYV